MSIKFNFTKLYNIYFDTLNSYDKSVAFELQNGKGKFLFMMFLSDEDENAKDELFVYMKNTKVMRKLKMYGSHKKGLFDVYINEKIQNEMTKELCLTNGKHHFDFNHFLEELNSSIPIAITQEAKIKTLRENINIINSNNLVDDTEKTVFIGVKHLSVGKPRDKTLRKLYYYTNNDAKDIDELIRILKELNMTVAWTVENDNNQKRINIRELINVLS